MNSKNRNCQFYLVCLLCFLSIAWSSLYISLFQLGDNGVSVPFKILVGIMDGTIGVLPLILFRGKWRFLELLPVVLIPLVALANVLFLRNYGDMIPGRMYFMSQIADPTVIEAARASFRMSDFSLLLLPVAAVSMLVIYRESVLSFKVRRRFLSGLSVSVLMLMLVVFAGSSRRMHKWHEEFTVLDAIRETVSPVKSDWESYMELGGLCGYVARCSIDIFNKPKEMSDEETERVKACLDRKNQDNFHGGECCRNGNLENLILIVVESLTSKVFDYPEKEIYMSCLSGLEKDPAALVVTKVVPQVLFGQSSDGQFMYNTGLLPLQDEALVLNYGDKDYPSLAKALGKESAEVIGESGSVWKHNVTTASYGFGSLYDNASSTAKDKDREIFQKALDVCDSFREGFFLFVSTLTMHDPYTDAKVDNPAEIGPMPGFTAEDINYLRRLNYFDNELCRFISGLKARGLFDKSLIVIASDHQIREEAASPAIIGPYIPWIILNSPVGGNVQSMVRQVDLFPTILEIFGKDCRFMGYPYSGLGRSILHADDEPSERDTVMEYEKEISRLLITRKYAPDVFRSKEPGNAQ